MKKWRTGLSLSAIAALAFTVACGNNNSSNAGGSASSPASGSPAASQASAASYKDDLKVAVTAQPPTLDSATTASALALDIAGNIFETLFTLNENYEPTPVLAESYTKSDDGLTYTIKLRQGVKFHNGKELTSDDVVASMNRWLVTSSRAKALLEGANFSALDAGTVELKLAKPNPDVLVLLSAQAAFPAIFPKEVIDSAPAEGITDYIGTGPYKLQEWKQDQYIHLVRNEDYVSPEGEPSGFAGKKEAATPNLYYYFVPDNATRIAGVKSGEYDIADSIPTENFEELSADSGVNLSSYPGGTLTAFLNSSEGAFKNEKLRQAAVAALNADDILLASFANPDLYKLDPGYMNPSQTQWASTAGSEYYNQNDQEKAKQLLQEAGYNGEKIVLLTTPDYSEMYAATLVIQEELKQVGFNVDVLSSDFPTFLKTKDEHSKWNLMVTSNGYQLIPPQLLAVTQSWVGLDDAQVKASVATISSATDSAAAKAEWDKLQGYLYEHAYSAVIGHYNEVVATSKKVEGFSQFVGPVVWNAKVAK
ncbi:ABC transporter substrate-binding protein [Cohnella sp. AR92]|uniref:ABC transporter substrate-binding protein n=1 Tax=Cohnella sp. AR92 TaxID=648716 RepID=UPI000F8CCCCA|nr:ABC transporter substrate-binding protein [Cohnella sp. AR92]RUS46588.1 ABC transporter substrate-binding protein [Cohnella sp. AR92]